MNGDDKLDALLSARLPDVEDFGFSSRVVARGLRAQERIALLETIFWLLLAGVVLAFMPLDRLMQVVEGFSLAASAPLAIVMLTLALTALVARRTSD